MLFVELLLVRRPQLRMVVPYRCAQSARLESIARGIARLTTGERTSESAWCQLQLALLLTDALLQVSVHRSSDTSGQGRLVAHVVSLHRSK